MSPAAPRAPRSPSLAVVVLLSLAVGAKSMPLGTVVDSLLHPSDTQDSVIITDLRVPRTQRVEAVFGLRCRVMPDPETGTPLVVPAARRRLQTAVG